jgi:hypothetical protein
MTEDRRPGASGIAETFRILPPSGRRSTTTALMVHHVTLFKLKPEVTPAKLEQIMMSTRMTLVKDSGNPQREVRQID